MIQSPYDPEIQKCIDHICEPCPIDVANTIREICELIGQTQNQTLGKIRKILEHRPLLVGRPMMHVNRQALKHNGATMNVRASDVFYSHDTVLEFGINNGNNQGARETLSISRSGLGAIMGASLNLTKKKALRFIPLNIEYPTWRADSLGVGDRFFEKVFADISHHNAPSLNQFIKEESLEPDDPIIERFKHIENSNIPKLLTEYRDLVRKAIEAQKIAA